MAIKIQATLPDRYIALDAELCRTLELDGLIDNLPVKYALSIRHVSALREAVQTVLLRRRIQRLACRAALRSIVFNTARRAQAAATNGLAADHTVRTAKQAAARPQRNTAALSASLALTEAKYRKLHELDPYTLSVLDGQLLSALDRITIAD